VSAAGRPIAVEFVGLPGVGKSTISGNTARSLAERGITVREPVRWLSDRSGLRPTLRGILGKSLLVARELLAHPADSVRAIRVIRATGQPSFSVLLRVTANWLMQCSLLRRSSAQPGVHLFDEGLFQALWSIGLEGRPGAVRQIARALGAASPLPDGVAIVEADVQAVARRLQERKGHESRADRWQRDDAGTLDRASALLREVLDVLAGLDEARRPWIVRVGNRSPEDAAASARQLAGEIERRAASA
jgi:hypothetical protein